MHLYFSVSFFTLPIPFLAWNYTTYCSLFSCLTFLNTPRTSSNLIHSFVYTGMLSSYVNLPHLVLFVVFFLYVLIWSRSDAFQHISKSDKRCWLTRWPPWSFINRIWHSVTLFQMTSYLAILFSFILIFTDSWFLFCSMAFCIVSAH